MAQPQDFFGAIDPTAAQVNAAARSGYGGGKGLRFLGNILAGLGQVRSGGLVGAGSTIVDRMNTQSYLDQLQKRQEAAAMAKYWADIDKKEQEYWGREDNKGIAQAQGLNLPDFRGTRAVTAQETDAMKYNNSIGALNDLMQGKVLQIPEGGQVDPALVRNYLEQQSNVAQARDFSQTQLPQQFLPKPGIYAQPNAKPQSNVPMLENPLAGLQGAVSQAQVQDPITQRSPFLQYSLPPIDQMRPIQERRQQDALNEAIRSNKADEALEAKRIAKMGSGGSGRAPNMLELMTPEQRTAYFNKLGGISGQNATLPQILKSDPVFQEMRAQLPFLEGSDRVRAKKDLAEYVQGVGAGERFKSTTSRMPALGLDGLTFGGGSQQKLNNAGAKATTPKGKSSAIPGLRFE